MALPHKNLKCENGFGSRSGERLNGSVDGWMDESRLKKKKRTRSVLGIEIILDLLEQGAYFDGNYRNFLHSETIYRLVCS